MGGEWKKAETSVQLSRGYIFYLTNYKRKTRQKKTQPFILLIEKSNKKIF